MKCFHFRWTHLWSKWRFFCIRWSWICNWFAYRKWKTDVFYIFWSRWL